MPKATIKKTAPQKKNTPFVLSKLHLSLIVLAIITIGVVTHTVFSTASRYVLGTSTLLARGGDDSNSGDSGSGSSGGDSSGSGSSGSGSSGSSSPAQPNTSSGSTSGGSGTSGGTSGSNGTSSGDNGSTTSVSSSTRVLCTGPDGKQFETNVKDCQELNAAWHKPANFTPLKIQTVVRNTEEHRQVVAPSITHMPEAETEQETEKPHLTPSGIQKEPEQESETTEGITKIAVSNTTSRVEQLLSESGKKTKVALTNTNGHLQVRVKSDDNTTTQTETNIELKPEDGTTHLTVQAGGSEHEITLSSSQNLFVIEQKGRGNSANQLAVTAFPITIDSVSNSIAVTTKLGTVNIQQLPSAAVDKVRANKTIDTVSSAELGESQTPSTDITKAIVYKLSGVKNAKFLGLIPVSSTVKAEVSAITGQQTAVSQPWFLSALGFLFTK